MTATTFCIAATAVQIRPSNGIDRTAWMTPPVTMLAVPIVSSTKPQKIPPCIRPARQSLNIFVWTRANSTSPTNRRGMSPSGRGWDWTGFAATNTRRWRAIAMTNTAAAPQNTTKTAG